MKSKIKMALIMFFALSFSLTGLAQRKISEGKVVFEMSCPDMELDATSASMMPTEMTVYFKDYLTRSEMNMGMGMSTVSISNGKDKNAIVLMDIMGNKTAMKMTEAEMARQKRKVPEYEIKQTEEKREIAGYPCKKADIKSKDGDFSVWYTEDIAVRNSNWDSPFKGIHGFLMEFAMVQNGMNMKLAAKKVSEEKVDDSMFIIPEGYKMTTPEELQKMFGK